MGAFNTSFILKRVNRLPHSRPFASHLHSGHAYLFLLESLGSHHLSCGKGQLHRTLLKMTTWESNVKERPGNNCLQNKMITLMSHETPSLGLKTQLILKVNYVISLFWNTSNKICYQMFLLSKLTSQSDKRKLPTYFTSMVAPRGQNKI